MKKITFILVLAIVASLNSFSQKKYWVMFKNKTGTPFSVSTPTAFLSPKSILRRTNQGIAVNNSDLPVTPAYVAQIAAVPGATVLYRSKWLNGVVVLASTTATATINSFTFVASTGLVNRYKINLPVITPPQGEQPNLNKTTSAGGYNYGLSSWQQRMLQVECLHNNGFRGQGMTIAVMDIGFDQVNTNPIFDSLFLENRLLGTRNFVNGDTLVFDKDSHGALVLSTMAGNKPGLIIGTAPKAKYWLLRTEDGPTETISEEYNWVRAVEFADSVGVDICTTSLGYTTFDGGLNDHAYSNLNGKTAPMSIASNMAARKGMVVLTAAGNDGLGAWHFIAVPADADSIITVGAVDSLSAQANFSSWGPTADGRIKPDLCARGAAAYVVYPGAFGTYGNGTSFATPILAGAVACFWQYKNLFSNMQVIQALKSSATNSAVPNNQIGWGVPKICDAAGVTNTVSINENNAIDNTVQLFPNPFNNELKIKLSGISSAVTILVTDVLGKILYSDKIENPGEIITINKLNELRTGVYFISISSATFNVNKKILKQ